MQQLIWLRECIGKRMKWVIVGMSISVIVALLNMVFPFITRIITNDVLVGETLADGTVVHHIDKLPMLLLIMLVAQVSVGMLQYTMTSILEFVSQNVLQEVKVRMYERLSIQGPTFYANHRTGDLMTRLTGDLDLVRHAIAWISYNIVGSISTFTFAIIYCASVNWQMTVIMLIITPILFLRSYFYSHTVHPLYVALRQKLSGMNTIAQENIEGNKTVRAFVREDFECEKFAVHNEAFRTANLAANMKWLQFFPMVEGFSQFLTVLTVLVGGIFAIQGSMTLGDIAAFTLLSSAISDPMRNLGVYLNDFQRFLSSASKIIEVYYATPRIASPEHPETPKEKKGTVTFKNVNFAYPNTNNKLSIKDVSFSIEHGKTLGIIGETGSGKTTLIDLLTRMYDIKEGEILVDGVNIKQWDLTELRRAIGVATQKVMLYSDSVASNVAYANPEQPLDEVHHYIGLAQAGFAEELPEGVETIIGEQGTGLSGGQKQRIALARALAKKASILVMDDTTSAVDLETETKMRESLDTLTGTCTKIMIAQRITAIQKADWILVLDHGSILQQGTHETLSQQAGYYRDICELQGVTLEEVNHGA